MYVRKDEGLKLIHEFKGEFLGEFEGSAETLFKIVNQDDWSFVIKIHAFIEALVTDLIISQVSDERLRSTIERLPLSDEQAGKLKIAKDMDLLSASDRKFIKILSRLRNDLAHKIENVEFSFEAYIFEMDNNQKKSWSSTISWYAKEDTREYYSQLALKNPKFVILLGVILMSGLSRLEAKKSTFLKKLNLMAAKTTSELMLDKA